MESPFRSEAAAFRFLLMTIGAFALIVVASWISAFLGFIAACIDALRRKDADVRRNADRSGLAGWFGGWF